jgi:ribosomal protein S18 acetylase RimI-like enzyme
MRLAHPEQLALVIDLLTEVSGWLVARGIAQWPSPPEPELHHLMPGEIAAGELYLAWLAEDEEAAGLLCFEWHYPRLWPEDPDGAGYVHSLAVRPRFQSREVGAAMLRWAAEQVGDRRPGYLRLDCVADNWNLLRYYERLGFRYRGVASYAGYIGARFELRLNR